MKNPKTILIIDDDETEGLFLAELFQMYGFEVGLALEINDGFDALNERDIDLVILDLNVIATSSTNVVKVLKNHYPDIEILIVSDANDAKTVTSALFYGANNFVYRPIIPQQVILMASKCLERKWLRTETNNLLNQLINLQQKFDASTAKNSDIY